MGWKKDRVRILKIPGYYIDLEKAAKIIKENNYERVVLQVPEGLKSHLIKFIDFLEQKSNADIIISADPCFGACDILSSELRNLNVDLITLGSRGSSKIGVYTIGSIANKVVQYAHKPVMLVR